jgi:hypothetical protein
MKKTTRRVIAITAALVLASTLTGCSGIAALLPCPDYVYDSIDPYFYICLHLR